MPVPAADGSEKALNPFGTSGVLPDSDHAWQLELTTVVLSTLDRKFSEQEALLRQLLAPTVELSGESSVALVEKVEAVNSAEASEPSGDLDAAERKTRRLHTGRTVTALGAQVMRETWEKDPPVKAFVKGPLDVYAGCVVIINVVFMILNTQWTGSVADVRVGIHDEQPTWLSQEFFDVTEFVFFSLYVLDVSMRLVVLRGEWWFDRYRGRMYLNVFDAALVLINFCELLLIPAITNTRDGDLHASHIRMMKLLRLARSLRIFKTVSMFRHLRNLVGTCVASFFALIWSVVLLLLVQLTFALIVCQALQGVILDDEIDLEVRLQMNNLYGSFLKAMYTVFEITLSGGGHCLFARSWKP